MKVEYETRRIHYDDGQVVLAGIGFISGIGEQREFTLAHHLDRRPHFAYAELMPNCPAHHIRIALMDDDKVVLKITDPEIRIIAPPLHVDDPDGIRFHLFCEPDERSAP